VWREPTSIGHHGLQKAAVNRTQSKRFASFEVVQHRGASGVRLL
jgi:hypothetical protein